MSHYSRRGGKLPRPKRYDRIAKRTQMKKHPHPSMHKSARRNGQMQWSSHLPRHKRERYEVITGQVGPRKYRRSGGRT